MSGRRLVAVTGAAFPYDRALRLLRRLPQVELDALDIPALIAAGKAMGWSKAVIEHHWRLAANGRCFRFEQDAAPELSGTLYEDNVFFSFVDDDHAVACLPLIEQIAARLGLEVRVE